MAKYFDKPFAVSGDKTPIPDGTQIDGSVSYETGFGYDYERDQSDPLAKDVPRNESNQLYYDITSTLQQLQQSGGCPEWYPSLSSAIGYPKGARVIRSGVIYESTDNVNKTTPGATGAKWQPVIPLDPTIAAMQGLNPTANQMIFFTALNVAAVTALTSFGRDLIGSANAGAARSKLGINNASQSVEGILRFGSQTEVNTSLGTGIAVAPGTLRNGVATSVNSSTSGSVEFPTWFATGQVPQFRYARVSLGPGQTTSTGNVFPNACSAAVGSITTRSSSDENTYSPIITPSGRGATIRNPDTKDTVNITVFMIGY